MVEHSSCGGASTKSQQAGGGSSSQAGATALGGAAVGGYAGAAAKAGASAAAGASGGPILSNDQCQAERAAACRALVGEAFLEVNLDGRQYHLGSGCDPTCAGQDVPALAAGLESNNHQSVTACDQASLVELIMLPGYVPSEVSLCSRTNVCTTYQLTE